MLKSGLSVNIRKQLLRIGNGVQDLRQVMCRLNSIEGRRLEGAGRGVVKAERLKNRHDVIAQPRPDITGVRNAQNHAPHRLSSRKYEVSPAHQAFGMVSRENRAVKTAPSKRSPAIPKSLCNATVGWILAGTLEGKRVSKSFC
jgi:hypothetical protein